MAALKAWVAAYEQYPIRDGDAEEIKTKKRVALFLYPFAIVGCSTALFTTLNGMYLPLVMIGSIWFLSCSIVGYVHLLWTRTLWKWGVELYCFCACIGIFIYDYATAATYQDRSWPIFVLVIDIFLVCKTPSFLTSFIVGLVVLWLTVISVESAFRVGIFDSPLTPSAKEIKSQLDCDSPPCAAPFIALQMYLKYLVIFLLDFYVTRGFANQAEEEKETMHGSIFTAQQVATALAAFDLEVAGEELDANPNLPWELKEAFTNILDNLESYKPFLPQALFEENSSPSRTRTQAYFAAPGVTSGCAALVFTDIQGSTATWEVAPVEMRQALKTHNSVMRRCMDEFNGYEVKTIGDAFMIAFEEASEALKFSLLVQEQLLAAVWPENLEHAVNCRREGTSWAGLRVRVGIHCGEVDIELNPLTGRYDYFGSTVNKAARAEAASVGGGVAVTAELIGAVGRQQVLQEAVVYWEGQVQLKGVAEVAHLSVLGPKSLASRSSVIEEGLAKRRQQSSKVPLTSQASLNTTPTQQSLERRQDVTVAAILLRLEEQSLGQVTGRVEKLLACLHRTSGTVIALLGSRVAAGWNVAGACAMHFQTGLRFVGLVERMMVRVTRDVFIGLSSGEAACGAVGTSSTRFATAVGPCVHVAGVLAETAVELGTLALCATLDRDLFFSSLHKDMIRATRPIGTCPVVVGSQRDTVVVYEINIAVLADYTDLLAGVVEDQEKAVWQWSQAYWEAFKAGDTEEISRHTSDDPTLAYVLSFLTSQQPLTRAVYL